MPNPNPSPSTRFQPLGETNLVFRRFAIRPDQAKRLALEENQAAAVRAALDAYFTIHIPDDDTDYGAALDAMAAEPADMKQLRQEVWSAYLNQ